MGISQRIILGQSIFAAVLIALMIYFHVGLGRIDRAAVRLQGEWVELQQMETLLDLLRRQQSRLIDRTWSPGDLSPAALIRDTGTWGAADSGGRGADPAGAPADTK